MDAPPTLQSLSPTQLEALGPDNAEVVTSQQRAALGDEQLTALERASTGSYEQPQTSDDTSGEGAPARSQVVSPQRQRLHLDAVVLAQGLHHRVWRASRPSRSRCSFS